MRQGQSSAGLWITSLFIWRPGNGKGGVAMSRRVSCLVLILNVIAGWGLLAVKATADDLVSPSQPFPQEKPGPRQIWENLVKCSTAPLKAYRVFKVGEASLWRENCAVRWPDGVDQPLVLEFRYNRKIPAHAFREAANNFLGKNGVTLTPAIHSFNARYRDVTESDVYRLQYDPSQGVFLSLNGELLAHIDSLVGWQYFSIWLGEHPFNESLKNRLLEDGKE